MKLTITTQLFHQDPSDKLALLPKSCHKLVAGKNKSSSPLKKVSHFKEYCSPDLMMISTDIIIPGKMTLYSS